MKKKGITLVLAILFIAVIAPVSVFAAWNWISQTKLENNTVTVDTPVYVTLDGASMNGTVKPGKDGEDTVAAIFNVDVDNAEAGVTYTLKITGIAKGTAASLDGWQYAVGEGAFTALTEGAILVETATTGEITLKMKATADLGEDWAGQSLTFAVELVEKAVA